MEAKCPMCNNELRYAFAETAANCMHCNFMCDISDLPRIAAAMELARAASKLEVVVRSSPCSVGEVDERRLKISDCLEDVDNARQRVLEVF